MDIYLQGLNITDPDDKEEVLQKLQLAKERLELLSKGTTKNVAVISKEKKRAKFSGKGSITEWLEDCETSLARFSNERDKANFLLDHLEGAAKTEVKFQVDIRKATSAEMLEVLKAVYGSHDTWIQLQQQFYSRDQKPGEDLMDYTYVLMDILLELRDKVPSGVKDMDNLLKQRVAEGVTDVTLKRELHRLNEERPSMKFHELREHAKDWLDSGRRAKKTAMQEEHTTSSEFQELKQLIQAQQQMLDELSKGKHKANTYQQEAQPEALEPLTCNYCGGLNHFKRNCIQFQKDNGTFGRNGGSFYGRGRGRGDFNNRGRGQRGFNHGNRGNYRGRGDFRGRGRGGPHPTERQPNQVGAENHEQTSLNYHLGWAGQPMTHPQQ